MINRLKQLKKEREVQEYGDNSFKAFPPLFPLLPLPLPEFGGKRIQDFYSSYKCLRTNGPSQPVLNTFLAMDICKTVLWETVPSTKLSNHNHLSLTEQKGNKGNWGSWPKGKLFDSANMWCRQTLENMFLNYFETKKFCLLFKKIHVSFSREKCIQ